MPPRLSSALLVPVLLVPVLLVPAVLMLAACSPEDTQVAPEAAEAAVEGLDASRQQQTLNDIRALGQGILARHLDQMGAGAAGQRQIPVESFGPAVSGDELARRLSPHYLRVVPTQDGWGHPLEVRLNPGQVHSMLLIRSPGRDGIFEGDTYTAGAFEHTDFDRDIVWVDQGFVRRPE
jgi:hypothetical protein